MRILSASAIHRGVIRCPVWNTSHTADFMIHVWGDATLTIGPYRSAGPCIINYAPPVLHFFCIYQLWVVSIINGCSYRTWLKLTRLLIDHRTCPTSSCLPSKIGKFVNIRTLELNYFKNIISACLLTLILVTSMSDNRYLAIWIL